MRKIIAVIALAFFASSAGAQVKGADNVLLIGSDAFAAFMLAENPGQFPNIESIASSGSSSFEVRSVLPSSSAVNWASILMGAGPELHGYTEWGSRTPELPSRVISDRGMFPGIFGLVRDKYPDAQLGVIYSWEGIGYLFDTTAVDRNIYTRDDDAAVTAQAVNYIVSKKPKFTFVYFSEPDVTGHDRGWESPEFFAACKQIDLYVGELLAAVEKADMKDNTVVIFTADHGGIGTGHGGKTMREMQVPYAISGPGIRKGYKITESMMVYDNAATIAHIFGIPRPQVWIARPPMSIFE